MGPTGQNAAWFPLIALLLAAPTALALSDTGVQWAQAQPDPHVRVMPPPARGTDRGPQPVQAARAECERLATSRWDLDRKPEMPGVDLDAIDIDRAERACTTAFEADPTDPRIAHRLARVRHRQGNHTAATRLYRIAADQGHAEAQSNLGAAYMSGQGGLNRNAEEAIRLFRLAADQGHAVAQYNLGFHFRRQGLAGLATEYAEAARLFRLSADQGYAAAQFSLGQLYVMGMGGLPQDMEEAVRLFQAAARAGLAQAQQTLTQLGRPW